MTELKKKRVKTVLKYTWPFYILGGIVAYLMMSAIFSITHPVPAYKTLTLFVSGEITNSDKLREDILSKYENNNLKSLSYIASRPTDSEYSTKLTVAGYSSADILIIPASKLENLNVSSFAINLQNKLISEYFGNYSFYSQDNDKYGVMIDKNKVNQYMALPAEDCYMFLNGRSQNLGEYSLKKPIKEHDNALNVVKEWGM